MNRFTPGQQVVCIHKGKWICHRTGKLGTGPKFNELVTIVEYSDDIPGNVRLKEFYVWENTYRETWFEPLVSDSILYKELSEIEITA